MSVDSIHLTRSKLYEQVWKTPITKLAKEYDISDVGLAKLCKRHFIPIPGRGYWAKKRHNRVLPKQPKLPALNSKNKHLNHITISKKEEPLSSKSEVDVITVFEKSPENLITIDYSSAPTNPIVIRTGKSMRSSKPDNRGVFIPKAKNCLDIKTSSDSISRAVHIMDSLLNALESRGARCTNKYYKFSDTNILAIELNDIQIEVSLEEIIKRIKHVCSPQEEARVKRDPYYRYKLPEFDYIPTGNLTLKMHHIWDYKGRKSWSDAKIQRLDNCLNDFLISFQKATIYLKEQENNRKLEELARQQAREKQEEFEKQKAEEQKRVNQLIVDCENWQQSQRIRQYIGEVENKNSKPKEWRKWALEQADRIDPLTENPKSILDKD